MTQTHAYACTWIIYDEIDVCRYEELEEIWDGSSLSRSYFCHLCVRMCTCLPISRYSFASRSAFFV